MLKEIWIIWKFCQGRSTKTCGFSVKQLTMAIFTLSHNNLLIREMDYGSVDENQEKDEDILLLIND